MVGTGNSRNPNYEKTKGSYYGGANFLKNIKDNLENAKKIVKYKDGYFGERSKRRVRIDESNNPLKTSKEFFDALANGGMLMKSSDTMKIVKMKDGSVITWRVTSTSDGSPVVDINIKDSNDTGGIKEQKIHFIKGGTHGKARH